MDSGVGIALAAASRAVALLFVLIGTIILIQGLKTSGVPDVLIILIIGVLVFGCSAVRALLR
jgi:hypothetical protein